MQNSIPRSSAPKAVASRRIGLSLAAGRPQRVGGVDQRPHVPERVRHAGVPGGGTLQLRRMVGDEDALEPFVPKDPDDLDDVDVAIVDEGLDVFWDLAFHVAEMDVPDAIPPRDVAVGLVDVARRHLLQRTEAELGAVGAAVYYAEQAIVFVRLVDAPRGAAHLIHRRVVRLRRKPPAGLF